MTIAISFRYGSVCIRYGDRKGRYCEHSFSQSRVYSSGEGAKKFPNFGHLHSEVGIWQLLPNSYMYYLHIFIIFWDACLQTATADGAIIHGVADKCS